MNKFEQGAKADRRFAAPVRIPTQVATRFRFIPPPDSDLSRHLIPI